MVAVLKTAVLRGTVGSNPTPSAIDFESIINPFECLIYLILKRVYFFNQLRTSASEVRPVWNYQGLSAAAYCPARRPVIYARLWLIPQHIVG